mgnify:CR=1 FL=1
MPYASNSSSTFYLLNKVNKDNPIVFIHGVGLSNKIWKPQINFFKEYNTLTYDLLGHGKTPLKKTKVTFNDFSRQLLNLINELKFEKIHLVGFSLGALIARHFASKHNERLRSLIIHGSIYKRSEEQKRVVINRFHVAKHNRPISKKSSITRWLTEDFISKNPKIYDEIYSILESNNNKNFLKCYELFTHYIDDDDEIEKMKVDAEKHAKEDENKKDSVDTHNTADQLIYQTEKQMKELDDKLTDDDKKDLNDALDKLKEANTSTNVDDIKAGIENLNSVWNTKASSMYQSSKDAGDAPQPDSKQDTGKVKDDKKIEDADFEVIEEEVAEKAPAD